MRHWNPSSSNPQSTIFPSRVRLHIENKTTRETVKRRQARVKIRHSFPIPKDYTLVRGQALHDLGHLLVRVYPETLVLGDARQLHVLRVELLLHDLLERLEDEGLGVGEGEGLAEVRHAHTSLEL